MSEAVPLAHALVARLAELEGVRILFIKGPTAVALGARPPRPVDRRRRAVRARRPRAARPRAGALRLAAAGAQEQRARAAARVEVPLRALGPLHPRRVAVRPRHPLQLPGLPRPRRRGLRGSCGDGAPPSRLPTGRCRAPTCSARPPSSACTPARPGAHSARARPRLRGSTLRRRSAERLAELSRAWPQPPAAPRPCVRCWSAWAPCDRRARGPTPSCCGAGTSARRTPAPTRPRGSSNCATRRGDGSPR